MAVSSLSCKNQDFFSSKLSFADVFFKLITLCVLSGSVDNTKLLAEADGKAMNTATFQCPLVVLKQQSVSTCLPGFCGQTLRVVIREMQKKSRQNCT